MKKVLLVDDEPSIVTLLAFNLEKDGYEVTTATDGAEGYRLAISNPFDFIILDLMLPSMDGMDICKRLRQEKFDTPIMILTAKDDELEKIIGLELGADDYMTKPFSPREVLARMKAILRRTNKAVPAEPVATAQPEPTEDETEKIEVGEITIFPQLYEVHVAGELIEVTPKSLRLRKRILSNEQRAKMRSKM